MIARLEARERTRITHQLSKVYFSKRGIETMLLRVLNSYMIFHRIYIYSFPKRILKINENDYMVSFPNILTQGKLLIAEKLPIKNKHFLSLGKMSLLREGTFGKSCKDMRKFCINEFRSVSHEIILVNKFHIMSPQDIHINELRQNITAKRN